MTKQQAKNNCEWLKTSILVSEGLSLEAAAETYDAMNGTREFQDSLAKLGLTKTPNGAII